MNPYHPHLYQDIKHFSYLSGLSTINHLTPTTGWVPPALAQDKMEPHHMCFFDLSSFTQHNDLEVLPSGCLYQKPISSYCCVILHWRVCAIICSSIHLLIDIWGFHFGWSIINYDWFLKISMHNTLSIYLGTRDEVEQNWFCSCQITGQLSKHFWLPLSFHWWIKTSSFNIPNSSWN